MRYLTMFIDTIPLGKRNEKKILNDQVADLLEEKYLCLQIAEKMSKKNFDDYVFVPAVIDNVVDFHLLRKNECDINERCVQEAIQIIKQDYSE